MARDGRDPFEGLCLDETFVRSARFVEPSADERVAASISPHPGRCRVEPARHGVHAAFYRWVWASYSLRGRRATRLVALLTLLAGMAGFGLFLLRYAGPRTAAVATSAPSVGLPAQARDRATAGASGTDPAPGPDPGRAAVPDGVQRFDVTASLLAGLRQGDCLAWVPDPSRAVTPVRVPCDQPHVDEVTRVIDLSDPFGEDWPARPALEAAASTDCAGALRDLAGTADPAPHTQVGSIYPEEPAWRTGIHDLVCTIRTDDLRPTAGSLRGAGVPA